MIRDNFNSKMNINLNKITKELIDLNLDEIDSKILNQILTNEINKKFKIKIQKNPLYFKLNEKYFDCKELSNQIEVLKLKLINLDKKTKLLNKKRNFLINEILNKNKNDIIDSKYINIKKNELENKYKKNLLLLKDYNSKNVHYDLLLKGNFEKNIWNNGINKINLFKNIKNYLIYEKNINLNKENSKIKEKIKILEKEINEYKIYLKKKDSKYIISEHIKLKINNNKIGTDEFEIYLKNLIIYDNTLNINDLFLEILLKIKYYNLKDIDILNKFYLVIDKQDILSDFLEKLKFLPFNFTLNKIYVLKYYIKENLDVLNLENIVNLLFDHLKSFYIYNIRDIQDKKKQIKKTFNELFFVKYQFYHKKYLKRYKKYVVNLNIYKKLLIDLNIIIRDELFEYSIYYMFLKSNNIATLNLNLLKDI